MLASLTIATPSPSVKATFSPRSVAASMPSFRSAAMTLPGHDVVEQHLRQRPLRTGQRRP